jgi:hypothetical protein
MTNTVAPIQGTAPISTTIDVGAASIAVGAGAPPPEVKQPEPKPETAGDTLRGELAKIREAEALEAENVKGQGEEAAKEAKAKVDATEKAEAEKAKAAAEKQPETEKAKPDDKAAKTETDEPAEKAEKSAAEKPAAGQEADKSRQSEGSKRNDPPARFLPKAKEAWVNVPHSVREDVYRMSEEHEAEVTKYKASTERYETLRPFDELAKSNGRDLRDSLNKITQIETALARNPITGLEMILREIGPTKPDGSKVSLYDVAQFVSKQTPQQFQQTQQQINAQQEQQKAQIQAKSTEAELEKLRTENAGLKYIAPFAAAHPRYHELQTAIAGVLKSGLIPASLSPAEKLEAAYDMAERLSPASKSSALQEPAPVAAKPAPADDAGAKSIRGAPSGGSDPDDDADDATDLSKLLRREARKLA